MFTTILIIIILLALGAILALVIKKLPRVMAIDTKSSVVKQASVKRRLLEDRFERHFQEGTKKIAILFRSLFKTLKRKIKDWYQNLVALEERYRHKVLKTSFKEEVVKEEKIEKLLVKAGQLLNDENYNEAEKVYIEILTLDEKNPAAYKGLGRLYLQKKDYEHAKETFEFLLKITQDDPAIYRGLGEIATQRGDLKIAEEDYLKSLEVDKENIDTYLKLADVYLNLEDPAKAFAAAEKAVTLEPNSPRALDFLIEVSIIVQDKATALKTYQQLKEVNPENQKFLELKEKIDKL